MTLKELRTQLRKALCDEVGSSDAQRFWKDAELNEYLNEGYTLFCSLTKIIRDSLSAVCTLTLDITGDVQHLPLSPLIIKIERVKGSWSTTPLTETTLDEISGIQPTWEDDTGTPDKYLLDYSSGYLSLNRSMESNATLRLTVRRLPLLALTDAASPEFKSEYHHILKTYGLYRAFSKQDAEIYKPEKALFHLKEFHGGDEMFPGGQVGRVIKDISEPLPNMRKPKFC